MLGRPSGSTVEPPKSIGVEPAERARRNRAQKQQKERAGSLVLNMASISGQGVSWGRSS